MLKQRQKDIELYMGLLDEVKEKVARGVAHDCWATQLLGQQEELQMKDIEIAYTAGGSFAAGVETVRTSTQFSCDLSHEKAHLTCIF